MLDFTRLDAIRQRRPLIHCVSNIVTANDCANLALAVGASPMMAQAAEEMGEITLRSAATVLNTGTPDRERFAACLLCGTTAQSMGQPVVLDPVGAGASAWRNREISSLLDKFTPTILRVNFGEAQALVQADSLAQYGNPARAGNQQQGVDSPCQATRDARLDLAKQLAVVRRTAVLLTGPEDIVTDGTSALCLAGGSPRTSSVTGTGCMLSVLCGAFAAVEPEPLSAAALAAAFWKLCAQRAELETGGRGLGSFRAALLDAAGIMTGSEFAVEAAVEQL